MPSPRLAQWVPCFRAPRPSQWRSCTAPAVGRFSSSGAPRGKRAPRRARRTAVPPPSIFDQLFPSGSLSAGSPAPGSRDVDVSVARGALAEDISRGEGDAEALGPRIEEEEEDDFGFPREEALLVVRNGSKSTLPSDFYRVAPRGKHLDGRGWSTMQGSHQLVIPILCARNQEY